MGIFLYFAIFLISLITIKKFHSKHALGHSPVTGLYISNQFLHLPDDQATLQALLHPDKAGRQHELVAVLNALIPEETVFPSKKIHTSIDQFITNIHKKMNHPPNLVEIVPYSTQRGWGGVVVDNSFGKYMYIIGYYNSIRNYLKHDTDRDQIEHLESKAQKKNSTNLVVCSVDLDHASRSVIHHGIGRKIDFIGCLIVK